MASNSFGEHYRFTTFGESHCALMGVVIDGCPAGLALCADEVNAALARRRPGLSPYTSPRKEADEVEIVSGLLDGVTAGAPIAMLIRNSDVRSEGYEEIKDLLRPGHANYTYLGKYGLFDYRGGGRASARETALRVAASVPARKILKLNGIEVVAFMRELGGVASQYQADDPVEMRQALSKSAIHCPDPVAEEQMRRQLESAIAEGDSLGGIVEIVAFGLPLGLGDPVYCKLEALLASALLSIPATKGFEIGEGFAAARSRGSQHNDLFERINGQIGLATNHGGGTLGGISTGEPLVVRVAFKPTSSIQKSQPTLTLSGEEVTFSLPSSMRMDPCVAIRGVAVAESMVALVLADRLLSSCAKISVDLQSAAHV